MERNINSLLNYNIEAKDGLIGEMEEFYFDDKDWKIRYLIVKTGNWLSDRKVLIPLDAILKEPWQNGVFPLNLTKEQVKHSPDIDTDKPVSRQQEIELYGHYQWQYYWGGGFYGGGSLGGEMSLPIVDNQVLTEADKKKNHKNDDIHLRSTDAVTNYHVHASNGDIGHVNDFIINDETWQIKFIVVDTHNWFGGKKVLIKVEDIIKIDWMEDKIFLDITTNAVEKSKLFDETYYMHFQTLK
jgi:uncharacterized protein YrrD